MERLRLDVHVFRDLVTGLVSVIGQVTGAQSPYPVAPKPADIYVEMRSVDGFPGTLMYSGSLRSNADGGFSVSFRHPNNGAFEAYRLYVSLNGGEDYKQIVYFTKAGLQVGLSLDWGGAVYDVTSHGLHMIDQMDTGFLWQVSMYDPFGNNPAQAGGYHPDVGNIKNPIGWNYYVSGMGDPIVETTTRLVEYPFGTPTGLVLDQQLVFPVKSLQATLSYTLRNTGSTDIGLGEGELPSIYFADAASPAITICSKEVTTAHEWGGKQRGLRLAIAGEQPQPGRPNIIRAIGMEAGAAHRTVYLAMLSSPRTMKPGDRMQRSINIVATAERPSCQQF